MSISSEILSFSNASLSSDGTRPSGNVRLRNGMILAVTAHLVLLLTLPAIPEMQLNLLGRSGGINVFLTQVSKPEEKRFEQTLNQPTKSPVLNQSLVEPAAGSATPNPGEQASVTEPSPEVTAQSGKSKNPDAKGKKPSLSIQPEVLINRAAITRFSQQYAVLYANQNADDLERFRRTFNSYRSYRRRSKTHSYENRYGDYYAKSSSSVGDVCYKQKRDLRQDEFSTNTVYFFRCDSKPKKFNLETTAKSDG